MKLRRSRAIALAGLLATLSTGCQCGTGRGILHFPDGSTDSAGEASSDTGAQSGDGAAGAGSDGGGTAGTVVRPTPMPESIYAPAVAFTGRRLWVMGGNDGCGAIDRVRYYDFDDLDSGWRTGPPMLDSVAFAAAVTDGAHIFVAGGLNHGSRRDGVMVLDVASETWTESPGSLPSSRSGSGGNEVAGVLLVHGGLGDGDAALAELLEIDAETYDVTLADEAPGPLAHHASGAGSSTLYVGGGLVSPDGASDAAYQWAPGSGWRSLPPLPTARKYPSGGVLGGRFVVVGGQTPWGEPLGVVEVYDPMQNEWASLPAIGANAVAGSVVVGEALYLVGGLRTTGPTAEVVVVERAW